LGIFIRKSERLILINSFAGKKFDDSPRAIYEYIKSERSFDNYDIIWAFDEPSKYPGIKSVKNDTFAYFITALRAKYWITNSSIERGLKFKSKDTIYINTWHGSPLKKMGIDAPKSSMVYKTSKYDYLYVQSSYDASVFTRAFGQPEETIFNVGLPRNDELTSVDEKRVMNIRKKLNIPKNKKVILYAPTFREYSRDSDGYYSRPPLDLSLWKEKLGDKYVILFRAHYEVTKYMNIEDDNFILNVTDYGYLNDLLVIADILVSDYSSMIFDYSILQRPIYCYLYDLAEYTKKRGMYLNIKNELPGRCFEDETELLQKISLTNTNSPDKVIQAFNRKFVNHAGSATKAIKRIVN
jgi:CDP-glycerol glycerophosphotransferase